MTESLRDKIAEALGEFKPHDYREHAMSDGEAAAVLGDEGVIADAIAILLHGQPAADPFKDWIRDWEHIDGSPCDAGHLAPGPRTSTLDPWWCTAHQKHLRPAVPAVPQEGTE